MIIFTLHRILLLIATLFLLIFAGFNLSYFTPHAPLQGALLWNAWIFWFSGLIHWDFSVSSINDQPIAEQLREVFPAAMELCTLAFSFVLIVGIPMGTIAGIVHHKWQDNLVNAVALLGLSVSVFWLTFLLVLFCSLTLDWLPISGHFDLLYEVKPITGSALIDAWFPDSSWQDGMIMSIARHMVSPVITLSVTPTTGVIRLVRANTIKICGRNYVKAAATHGLSHFTILRCHVLYNALPPAISRPGLQSFTMLTLVMITEVVFS